MDEFRALDIFKTNFTHTLQIITDCFKQLAPLTSFSIVLDPQAKQNPNVLESR